MSYNMRARRYKWRDVLYARRCHLALIAPVMCTSGDFITACGYGFEVYRIGRKANREKCSICLRLEKLAKKTQERIR